MLTLPMASPPVNEMGVVHLFSDYARRHRMQIGEIRAQYPDAIVIRRTSQGDDVMHVEFEFRSSNFRRHRHDLAIAPKVWIVCWEDDWPDKPESVGVIELRDEYDLGWGCWWHTHPRWEGKIPWGSAVGYSVQGFHPRSYKARAVFQDVWVPARAKVGDLVLCHFEATKIGCKRMGLPVADYAIHSHSEPPIWLVGFSRVVRLGRSVVRRVTGNCVSATIRRVVSFDPIVRGGDVFSHPSVGTWDDLTGRWPEIRRRLTQLRPDIIKMLEPYA